MQFLSEFFISVQSNHFKLWTHWIMYYCSRLIFFIKTCLKPRVETSGGGNSEDIRPGTWEMVPQPWKILTTVHVPLSRNVLRPNKILAATKMHLMHVLPGFDVDFHFNSISNAVKIHLECCLILLHFECAWEVLKNEQNIWAGYKNGPECLERGQNIYCIIYLYTCTLKNTGIYKQI